MCLSCLWMFWLIKVETCIFWIGLTHCGHGAYLSMLFGVYAGIIYLMIFQHQIFSKKNTQQKDRAKKVFFQLRLRFFSTFGSCVHSFELIFTLRIFHLTPRDAVDVLFSKELGGTSYIKNIPSFSIGFSKNFVGNFLGIASRQCEINYSNHCWLKPPAINSCVGGIHHPPCLSNILYLFILCSSESLTKIPHARKTGSQPQSSRW